MYRSESGSQVLAFLNKIFPPSYRPSFIAYDNSCSLLAHIFSGADEVNRNWFTTTRFIVDSFHYVTHRVTDHFCRVYCNPAPADGSQPDLVILKTDDDGIIHSTRAFNTETAEQLNSWLSAYEGPMKQMSSIRFDFVFHCLMLVYKEEIEDRIQQRADVAAGGEQGSGQEDDDIVEEEEPGNISNEDGEAPGGEEFDGGDDDLDEDDDLYM